MKWIEHLSCTESEVACTTAACSSDLIVVGFVLPEEWVVKQEVKVADANFGHCCFIVCILVISAQPEVWHDTIRSIAPQFPSFVREGHFRWRGSQNHRIYRVLFICLVSFERRVEPLSIEVASRSMRNVWTLKAEILLRIYVRLSDLNPGIFGWIGLGHGPSDCSCWSQIGNELLSS